MQQTATHWELSDSAPADRFGNKAFKTAAPILLTPDNGNGVFWQDKVDKTINNKGDVIMYRGIVWSATTEFEVGDYLYRGRSSATNPQTVTGADQIRVVERITDVKSDTVLYKAFL